MSEPYSETLARVLSYQARESARRESSRREEARRSATKGSHTNPKVDVGIGSAVASTEDALKALCCLACGYYWVVAWGSLTGAPDYCPGCGFGIAGFNRG